MSKLNNKVALITGGNSGIGFATAQAFIKEGARVIITGRNQTALDEAVVNLGAQAVGILADASNLAHSAALAEKVKAQFGSLDVLFINAGIAKFAPVEHSDEAFLDEMMNINFKGAFFTVQSLLPLLNQGASILFNTTVSLSVGMPNSAVYAASKAALLSFGRVLATELSPKGIRVNSISPGPISTPIYSKLGFPQEALDAFGKNVSSKTLLGRFGTADEIAKTAIFLASADASYITGTEIVVDGGILVNPTDR
jgi:NAD(P)-dependent dehydrogenase (short-subunit alcohol dehydrogenase family)